MREFPTICDACGGDLKQLNPIYTLKDDKKQRGWCSRRCRSKETGEDPGPNIMAKVKEVEGGIPTNIGKITVGVSAPVILNHSLVSSPNVAPVKKSATTKPAAPPKSNNIKESVDKPWRNLNGKMYHVKGAKVPNMTGLRKQVYQLIKDGMKVSDLYAACEKAGLDGPQNLRTITHIYKVVEVK